MIWAWLIFIGSILVMLALDLGDFHRKSHVVGFKKVLGWSGAWITVGLSFFRARLLRIRPAWV